MEKKDDRKSGLPVRDPSEEIPRPCYPTYRAAGDANPVPNFLSCGESRCLASYDDEQRRVPSTLTRSLQTSMDVRDSPSLLLAFAPWWRCFMLRRKAQYQNPGDLPTLPLGTVLVVDEDNDDLEYYSGLLAAGGYNVLKSNCYERATLLVEQCDFVLVSQGGPAFEGRCVLKQARERPVGPPVLILARSKDMRCYLEAMQLGAVDYLEKPVTPASLHQVLKTYFHPRAHERRSKQSRPRLKEGVMAAKEARENLPRAVCWNDGDLLMGPSAGSREADTDGGQSEKEKRNHEIANCS